MLFSTAFAITPGPEDDWFDAIVETDTKLFVDPFLIFQESLGFWAKGHDLLMDRFNKAFQFVAAGYDNHNSLAYKKALGLLKFKEPKEFCLGFTKLGTKGAGGSDIYAAAIAGAMEAAITRGLKDLKHFEELGVLNEGIGPDRISDLTCTFLKSQFVSYTQAVCQRLNVPMAEQRLYASTYDSERDRWVVGDVLAPINPVSGLPILLVPARFLRWLPTLNANDWFDWYESEQIKTDLNYKVMGSVDKKTIVALARKTPKYVQQYGVVRESEPPRPYNLKSDPAGVYGWYPAATEFVAQNPITLPQATDEDDFLKAIEKLVDQFQLYIEDKGGWKLLWNDSQDEKYEEAAQLLFSGIAGEHCRANQIVVDREVELGRGPVDFKFTSGYHRRALMEVKKLHNTKFWQGLRSQLPSYLRSDECRNGWFLVIRYDDGRASTEWLSKLANTVSETADAHSVRLKYRIIDARPKASASNIDSKPNDDVAKKEEEPDDKTGSSGDK